METSAATVPAADTGSDTKRTAPAQATVLWTLAGLTALGVALRFSTLGLQSYHHDEVITAGRVISGSFGHMLHEVKAGESNPPLYYALAWGWAKLFGNAEFGRYAPSPPSSAPPPSRSPTSPPASWPAAAPA